MYTRIVIAIAASGLVAQSKHIAHAQQETNSPSCPDRLDAPAVVACSLARSPEIRRARADLNALAGRRQAAGVLLPSLPEVEAEAARRTPQGAPDPARPAVWNWTVSLSQQLEIGGQRAARIERADAETRAQLKRVVVAEQTVAAEALLAYFDVAAARQRMEVAERGAKIADQLSTMAEERSKQSLISGVDADVVAAEGVRIGNVVYEATRRLEASEQLLNALVGRRPDAPVSIGDELDSPATFSYSKASGPGQLLNDALGLRADLAAAGLERAVLEAELRLIRRGRVPNPRISGFVARDEIDDRIVGVRLTMPIPAPSPLWPSRAGEIAEAIGRIEAAQGSVDLLQRRVELDVRAAWSTERARREAHARYRPALIARARTDLANLAEAISSRQMSIRDALLAQRSLIELLDGYIEARLELARAWVELRRAAGLDLTGGVR